MSKYSPLDDASLEALADVLERRHGEADRRKDTDSKASEWLRWVIVLGISAALSYFTTIGTMDKSIDNVKTTEEAHFQELLRRMDLMQADIRELRGRP